MTPFHRIIDRGQILDLRCFGTGNGYARFTKGKNTSISVKGRHDPCVGIRAVPIGEAMTHCVILDHYLMNKAQCGK